MANDKTKPWERLENETDAAFSAFKTYLELDERSCRKVAEKLKKSTTLIHRWADKFDWKNRAIAWDNSLLEELRIKEKQNLSKTIRRQLKELKNFQEKAADGLSQKDLSKASVKSLNEMYHSALQAHWTLLEKIGVTNSEEEISEDDVIIQVPEKNKKI